VPAPVPVAVDYSAGTPGADGKTLLYGTAAPMTQGVDGDFYINTTTNSIYGPKAGGAWPAGVSLGGPSGASDFAELGGVPADNAALAEALALKALTTDLPNDYEIASAEGRRLIASMKAEWIPNAGMFYFATTKPLAGQITVKTSTGYARIIDARGGISTGGGTGVAANSFTLSVPFGGSHRAFAVVSTASLTGTTRSGDITYLGLGSSYNNQLTAIDVASATALTFLTCYGNQLTELNVSANTALTYLACHSNQLKSLNVSNNTALTSLECYSNQLTALDVSTNTALTNLSCGTNQLTALDVSTNLALTNLSCGTNQLTALDVSANTALTNLSCGTNQLTALDVSTNLALTSITGNNNQLTGLNDVINTSLTTLNLQNNLLTTAAVDQILVDLDALNVDGQFVVLNGTGNGAASATGVAAAAGLVTDGWSPVAYN
jgi:hypothetical protein